MAQPTFVPVPDGDKVRPSIPPPVPTKTRANRPGELRSPVIPAGKFVGTIGPDQGYAMALARRLRHRLALEPGEDAHDVELGVALLASKRASAAGRAPSAYDVSAAAGLFGYLGPAPADLVAYRSGRFAGLAHSYDLQRALVDGVPEATLRAAPSELDPAEAPDPAGWRARLIETEATT